jgi:hypothetical protein
MAANSCVIFFMALCPSHCQGCSWNTQTLPISNIGRYRFYCPTGASRTLRNFFSYNWHFQSLQNDHYSVFAGRDTFLTFEPWWGLTVFDARSSARQSYVEPVTSCPTCPNTRVSH